ncbi:MAG TPA: NAD+ synthase [Solirubrobacteraceae bacterium]|jgi:NAD+ synthase (glutamine-hydrolysing)|nr:NAD+ synthase [Solirubrobacteraceae bacterium]
MSRLRLALCQMNATVGDLTGNAERIRAGVDAGREAGAQVVLFPELALSGYPPEDLLLRAHFLEDIEAKLHTLASAAKGIVAIVGFPERGDSAVYNSAAVLAHGSVHAIYRKVHLPNYGVFDEQRYFKAGGSEGMTVALDPLLEDRDPRPDEQTLSDELEGGLVSEGFGVVLGVTVCEDLWVDGPPASAEAAAGARLILNASASPYHAGKGLERERLFGKRARETDAYVAFCGMVGGQDELVFDGHSFVLDPNGETIARGAQFLEELIVCDIDLANGDGPPAPVSGRGSAERPLLRTTQPGPNTPESQSTTNHEAHTTRPHSAAHESTPGPPRTPIASREQEVYEALRLGLYDYVEKNGFGSVVLGLSGGIDSALVACLAADALGAERVNVAIMPSPYSSSATQEDARALARALGLRVHELTIEPVMDAYAQTLRAYFEGLETDLTEENLQARIRGNLLMALSNKFGWLVLTTGNKSEMSVGYTTLYGDLAGGFAVIKDVPKTLVYRLARWRNEPSAAQALGNTGATAASTPIPTSIVERAPSAELRENQTDQDSLPPYELLDRILHGYIELDRSREQLIAEGLPRVDVERTARLVDLAEYKRRQAPPGIKITERAFGRDRRMPITNAYRG